MYFHQSKQVVVEGVICIARLITTFVVFHEIHNIKQTVVVSFVVNLNYSSFQNFEFRSLNKKLGADLFIETKVIGRYLVRVPEKLIK